MPPDLTTRFCLRFNLRLRRLALACVAAAGLVPALVAAPAVAEEPTPQAVNAHAEFLADPATPPPPAPVKVCVVDTGVDLTTDAAPAVVERYSEFGGTVDDTGGGGIAKHGTYVAGVIASQMDGVGSVGIWPRARIVSVRVFPDKDSGTTVATYLQALDLCRTKGTRVVNLSLSGLAMATGDELRELENKMTNMHLNYGMNVVAAVGNGAGAVGYPARFAAAFAVGANDFAARFCGFSSRGPELDISAIGCSVLLSLPDGRLGAADGTSYATPVVSGSLAALRAYRPDLTATEAEKILVDTAQQGAAGSVLDLTAAFRAAGLSGLIASTREQPVLVPSPSSAPTVMTTRAVTVPSDFIAILGVAKPRVRVATYRRGVLSIRLAAMPDFARAIFAVDGRHYRRASGDLRIRLKRRPKRVTVYVEVPGVGRTPQRSVRIATARTNSRPARS